MAMEDGWTADGSRRKPVIRGGSAARPKAPPPRVPARPNTFVSEIGRPLFEGVDLDSHLERFVLDAVDGELPAPTAPATPPPAPKVAARPPPLKPRASAPAPKPSASLLPDLGPQLPESRSAVAPKNAPLIRGAWSTTPQVARSSESPSKVDGPLETPQQRDVVPDLRAPAPTAGVKAEPHDETLSTKADSEHVPSTAEVEAELEPTSREVTGPESAFRGTSEASGMVVDALPPPGPSAPAKTRRLSEQASAVLDQLRRVPRDAWETGAAALLGGIIGYQASSLLMWLLG